MTQAAAVPILRYDGNDSATTFAFGQYFSADDELVVIHKTTAGVVTLPVLDTDFTVTGEGTASSGSVDFPKGGSAYSTLASGSPAERLTLIRRTDLDRLTDMSAGFFFSDLNAAGDKMQRQIQENSEKIGRAALQTESNSDTVPTLESVLAGTATLDITSLDALATLLDAHVLHVNDGVDKKVAASTIWTYILAKIDASKYVGALKNTLSIKIVNTAGSPLVTGAKKVYKKMPYSGTITGWWVEFPSGVSDTITLDIWKAAWAVGTVPTVANTIITGAGVKPNVGGAARAEKFVNLTDWTVAFSTDDVFEINIDAVGGTATEAILHLDHIITGA